MIGGIGRAIVLAGVVPRAPAGCAGVPVTPEIKKALAPTGPLRVGVYPGSPSSMLRDPVSGESKGITIDLGTELAARLGVPYTQVEFARVAEVLEAIKAGAVDFTVTNATAARAKDMDFSGNVLDIELGYLALAGSPVASFADVDRPGIRIGVTEGGTSHRVLPSQFRHATVAPATSMKNAIEMLSSGKVDAYATNKPILFEMSDQLPNSRVLEGGWGLEHLAIAIPRGRDSGLPFLHAFAEDAKSRGLVDRAAARAGMRGITKPQ